MYGSAQHFIYPDTGTGFSANLSISWCIKSKVFGHDELSRRYVGDLVHVSNPFDKLTGAFTMLPGLWFDVITDFGLSCMASLFMSPSIECRHCDMGYTLSSLKAPNGHSPLGTIKLLR